ncbi:DUF6542 domain-containing protein, partial [Kitasatospora sp. NPDC002551]|uniref:DUF6542 domain-containing protein n=1 Tax=Kitasatospora sp. NPDC002551 TaxID=3154539 RepID=UPI003332244A
GHGGGPLFAAGAVLGTGAAAALCGRAGRWWVVIAAPPVALAARAGTAYLADRETLRGNALASAAVRWVVGAFPVMAAAVVAGLLVVAVRALLDRRARPDRRADDRHRRRTAGPQSTAPAAPAPPAAAPPAPVRPTPVPDRRSRRG